jgi:hypothetical protein
MVPERSRVASAPEPPVAGAKDAMRWIEEVMGWRLPGGGLAFPVRAPIERSESGMDAPVKLGGTSVA